MFEIVIDTLKTHFGESLTYKGNGSLDVSFVGIFDEAYTYVDPETGQRVSTDKISILLKLEDLPQVPVSDDEFVRDGTSYLVRNIEKDGKGAARIWLMEED